MEKEKWSITSDCSIFLSGLWNEEIISKAMNNDPIKWIREEVNPWLRARRKEGKDFPIVQIKKNKEKLILKLSTEN